MNELAVIEPKEIELVKRTVATGATDDELKLYFYDCERRGVHPLDKLIHFTKRGGKYVPITSIDFMRQRATASGDYAGKDPSIFKGEPGKPGFEATLTVYRLVQGVRCAWTSTARWSEYFPGEQQGHMWKKMPHVMLEKCAEALALRQAFPNELQGLYTKEEMEQADDKPVKPQGSLKDRVMKQVEHKPFIAESYLESTTEEAGPLPDSVPTVEPPVSLPPPFPYPAHDVVLTFGKMKGKRLSECPIDYLEWLAAEKRKDVQSPMEHRAKAAQEMLDHVEVVLSWMQVQPTLEMGEAQ